MAASSGEQQSKTISLADVDVDVEKGHAAAEEVRIIRNYLLAALIKHVFNFFYLVILAGYIVLSWRALKFNPLFYAVLEILVITPYFWLMLKGLPILKRFYIKKYATGFVDAFMWFALSLAGLVVICVLCALLAFFPLKLHCKTGFLPCINIAS